MQDPRRTAAWLALAGGVLSVLSAVPTLVAAATGRLHAVRVPFFLAPLALSDPEGARGLLVAYTAGAALAALVGGCLALLAARRLRHDEARVRRAWALACVAGGVLALPAPRVGLLAGGLALAAAFLVLSSTPPAPSRPPAR